MANNMFELMMANSAKEDKPESTTPSFAENFGKSFLDIYKNKNFGAGGGGGSDSDASPFQVSDMGGASIQPFGTSGKHQLFTYIGSKPIIQQTAPSQPGLGEKLLESAAPAAFTALLACDERVKVDMAPLESTEVNDALAEVAFFVKGLRECA
jgi:hypothetical protein